VSCAGLFWLKGAFVELGLDEVLVEVIQSSYQSQVGPEQSEWCLQHSSVSVISQYNQTLMFYPFFKDMRRPIHLTSYNNDDLGILSGSGSSYQYATIDRYLRELTHVRVSEPLGDALAECYWRQWYQSGPWPEQHVFYLDAHEKIVWTSKPGPTGFVSACHEVRACLKQFYIHGYGGHVLYCETRPCDVHLSEHLLAIINHFEAAIERPVVQVIVVDREGLAADVILALLSAKKAIVTLLRANQYSGEDDFERRSRFLRLKDPRTSLITHRVADADWWLTDTVKVRCGLVYPIDHPDRLVVVVTTVNRHRAPDIRVPVMWYLNRWEVQENCFRALEAFVHIDLNFGLNAKRQVPDRHVAIQLTELTQHLQAVECKIEHKQEQHTEIQDQIENQLARYDGKLAAFHRRLVNARRQASKDAARQAELADYQQRHHKRLAKRLTEQHQLETALEQHQVERTRVLAQLAALDPHAMFFEIDAEKDQIVTHVRIAAYNCALFAREQYFGPAYQRTRPITLWRLFFSQDGYYRETEECVLITLKPFRDQQLHQAALAACQRFNERRIRLRSGKWLQMAVGECK
jgi:hypothetical protein